MDTFLVGATLLIAAFGFYELFVIKGEREGRKYWLPGWLKMHDLEDLKARVVSMLILVAAITFVDRTVEAHDEQEVLFLGLGISIIIAALTAFLWFGKRRPQLAGPPPADAPPAGAPPAGAPTAGAPGSATATATPPASHPAPPPAPHPPAPVGGPAPPDAALASGATLLDSAVPSRRRRTRVVALLGSSTRQGRWDASSGADVIALAGWARIDLTTADVRGERLNVRVISILGLVSIAVPPDMAVADSGLALLGSRSVRGGSGEPGELGGPTLVLSGAGILGAVRVRRTPYSSHCSDFS
jgi:Uncharacterized protein family, UPF0114